jgi:hypothetical protein
MALTTSEKVRELGNLSGDLDLAILSPHIFKASKDVVAMVTQAVYDTAQTDADEHPDDKDREQITLDLVMGETYMSLAYSLPSLSMRSLPEGGLVSSVGFSDGKSSLLSIDEIKKLQKEFYEGAMTILRPYIDTPEDFGEYDFIGGDFSLIEI